MTLWFEVDRRDFVGFSAEALEIVNEERTWFEVKVSTQLFLAYQHAISKAADVVSSISDTNRVVVVRAVERKDRLAARLSIRFFNNFLREAVKKKDVHAIYDVFYQYRLLAKDILQDGELLHDVIGYFKHYSERCSLLASPS